MKHQLKTFEDNIKIRLIVKSFFNSKDGGEIEDFIDSNIEDIEKLKELPKLEVIDFEVPSILEEELINDICSGKAFNIHWENNIDFHHDYYNHWIYRKVNGKWE